MDRIEIREFIENDRQVLQKIYLECRVSAFYWRDHTDYTLSDFDTATVGEYILVALLKDQVVGFIAAWKPESFIHHLYVDTHYHRNGIGKTLLDRMLAILEHPVRLKCLVKNKSAVVFYKSSGWKYEMMGMDGTDKYYALINR